jgi:branched-chain amino acid transport system substrate-binding protein
VALLVVAGLVTAACGSSGNSGAGGGNGSGAKSGPMYVLNVADFSGALSYLGAFSQPSLQTACNQINKAGGVLGHQCVVKDVDDHGDPADGAVALRQALAATPNVMAVSGLVTQTASAEVPIAIGAHLVTFTLSGASTFLSPAKAFGSSSSYLYMTDPADETLGFGLALAAKQLGLKHPAVVMTASPDATPAFDGVLRAATAAGIKPAITLQIAPSQSSYGSEAERVAASHPDGVIFEIAPTDAGVFLGNLASVMGGIKIPLVSDDTELNSGFTKSVNATVGLSAVSSHLHIVGYTNPASSPGAAPLVKAYPSFKSQIPFTPAQQLPLYDEVILTALAMLKSHSTNPSVYGPDIAALAAKSNDTRTRVYTYAEGKAALAQGKQIAYYGGSGALSWNSQHVRVTGFDVGNFVPVGKNGSGGANTTTQSVIPVSQVFATLNGK